NDELHLSTRLWARLHGLFGRHRGPPSSLQLDRRVRASRLRPRVARSLGRLHGRRPSAADRDRTLRARSGAMDAAWDPPLHAVEENFVAGRRHVSSLTATGIAGRGCSRPSTERAPPGIVARAVVDGCPGIGAGDARGGWRWPELA